MLSACYACVIRTVPHDMSRRMLAMLRIPFSSLPDSSDRPPFIPNLNISSRLWRSVLVVLLMHEDIEDWSITYSHGTFSCSHALPGSHFTSLL